MEPKSWWRTLYEKGFVFGSLMGLVTSKYLVGDGEVWCDDVG